MVWWEWIDVEELCDPVFVGEEPTGTPFGVVFHLPLILTKILHGLNHFEWVVLGESLGDEFFSFLGQLRSRENVLTVRFVYSFYCFFYWYFIYCVSLQHQEVVSLDTSIGVRLGTILVFRENQ